MSNLPKWLQVLIEFLLDNFVFIVTIIYVGIVVFRQKIADIAVTTDDLLSAILIVLTLLAISGLVERYRKLNSIQKSIEKIANEASAVVTLPESLNLSDYINGANQIDLCGVSLTGTIGRQYPNLRDRLKEGARIRILIGDSEKVPEMSSARSGISSSQDFKDRWKATSNNLNLLYNSWQKLKGEHKSADHASVSVKLLPFIPSFAIYGFDILQPHGTIIIELYPHFNYTGQPAFVLKFRSDSEMYTYFTKQFNDAWDHDHTQELKLPTSLNTKAD